MLSDLQEELGDQNGDQAVNDKFNDIIEEFAEQRNSLKEMVTDLDDIKIQLDKLFPAKLDKRYMHLFEEKMNAITGVFNTLLSIKKEIMRGLKDEFDLRRKIDNKDGDVEAFLENFELAAVAKNVIKLKKDLDKKKDDRKPLRTKGEKHVRQL